jgi:death-on-curing protein
VLFLWINGYRHEMPTDTAFDLVLGVARGDLELDAAATIIRTNLLPRTS